MSQPAIINATAEQKAIRNIARIKTLRLAVVKAETRGHPAERIESLKAELTRREGEAQSLRDALASIEE